MKKIVIILMFFFQSVSILWAANPEVYIETPSIISGNVLNDSIFWGEISVGATLHDPYYGNDKSVYYSLDGGSSWANAENISPVEKTVVASKNDYDLQQDDNYSLLGSNSVVLNDGNILISWHMRGTFLPGTDTRLYGMLFKPDGNPITSKKIIASSNYHRPEGHWIHSYKMQPLKKSNGFILLQKMQYNIPNYNAPSTIYRYLIVKRYDNNMNLIKEVKLFDYDNYLSRHLYIKELNNGNIVLVWADRTEYDIFSQIIDVNLNTVKAQFKVNAANTRVDDYWHQSYVQNLHNGNFVIAWMGGDSKVTFQIFDMNGNKIGPEKKGNNAEHVFYLVRMPVEGFAILSKPFGRGHIILRCDNDGDQIGNIIEGERPIFYLIPLENKFYINIETEQIQDDNSNWVAKGWFQLYDQNFLPVKDKFLIDDDLYSFLIQSISPLSESNIAITLVDFNYKTRDELWLKFFRTRIELKKQSISPNKDISLVFKVVDTKTNEVWVSPVREYIYQDPNAGSDGSIVYSNGYTSDSSAIVGIQKPDIAVGYKSVQLYYKTSVLSNGTCTGFSNWLSYDIQTTLTQNVDVPILHGLCYQFKWTVTNNLDSTFDYVSSNIIKVDITEPVIDSIVSDLLIGSQLKIQLSSSDPESGTKDFIYVLNNGPETNIIAPEISLPLVHGANYIRLKAINYAGLIAFRDIFNNADLSPAEIVIYSIEEGNTYGDDLTLGYNLTQPLTDIVIKLNGKVVSDLNGLADGNYTLEISGKDSENNLISKQVNFTKNNSQFSVTLLSPQDRIYEQDSITIQHEANQTVQSTQITVDGIPITGSTISNLSNGNHSIVFTATATGGATKTITRNFSVNKILPSLTVQQPIGGSKYTQKKILVEFQSNSNVSYKIGSLSGSISSGNSIMLSNDGNHQLTLTATHPSGNVLEKVINFSVDSVPLEVTLKAPVSKVYSIKNIPIEFTSNKNLISKKYTLNGMEVTSLNNLTDGDYTFYFEATDNFGRTVSKFADFSIVHLDIISPIQNEEITSDDFPPYVNLEYSSGGNFNYLTSKLDSNQENLLTSPSSTVQLQTLPGQHELTLSGYLNEVQLAKQVNFKIGAKNVVPSANGIKYISNNCTDDLICDVDITLRIINIGDFNIDTPFKLVFEYITPVSKKEYSWDITGLDKGAGLTRTLSTFKATYGDIFKVTIDPEKAIPGEDYRDNLKQIDFVPAKIVKILSPFADDEKNDENYYIQGISMLNVLAVETGGNIAYLEFDVNGTIFVDKTGEKGFSSIVDMGLLTPENNYIVINAYNQSGILLDSVTKYFKVKKLGDKHPIKDQLINWDELKNAYQQIDMGQVKPSQLAREKARIVKNAIKSPFFVAPKVSRSASNTHDELSYHVVVNNSYLMNKGQNDTVAMRASISMDKNMMKTSQNVTPRLTYDEDQLSEQRTTDEIYLTLNNIIKDDLPNVNVMIEDAFDRIKKTAEPYTGLIGGFLFNPGIGSGVWGIAFVKLNLEAPTVSFKLTPDDQNLDFEIGSRTGCNNIGVTGSLSNNSLQLNLDCSFEYMYHFDTVFRFDADFQGGKMNAFAIGAAGLIIPFEPYVIPLFAFYGWANATLYDPSFTGLAQFDAHQILSLSSSNGLQTSLVDIDTSVDMDQTQKLVNGSAYFQIILPIFLPITPFGVEDHEEIFLNPFIDIKYQIDNNQPINLDKDLLDKIDDFDLNKSKFDKKAHTRVNINAIRNFERKYCLGVVGTPVKVCKTNTGSETINITNICNLVGDGIPGVVYAASCTNL